MATEKVKVFEEGSRTAGAPVKKGTPIWMWLLPLLLLLGLGSWLLTRNRDRGVTTVVLSDATKPVSGSGTSLPTGTWTAASISDAMRKDGRIAFSDADVHFATGSASLAGDSQAVLDQASEAVNQNASWHVRVVGHTDSVGTDAANNQLAQQRAESVKTYMVSHGVDAGRLNTEAKGASEPTTTNATDSGRAENRRVELIKQ